MEEMLATQEEMKRNEVELQEQVSKLIRENEYLSRISVN